MKSMSVLVTLAVLGLTSTAGAQTFASARGDGICPSGYSPATAAQARGDQQAACSVLSQWAIARLAGGGSMDGRGYGCKIRDRDTRRLGDTLCHRAAAPTPPAGFVRQRGDGQCPSGYVLASATEAREDVDGACAALETWTIARLAGGGSMDGRGYGCKIRDADDRPLGDSLCRPAGAGEGRTDTECIVDTLLPDYRRRTFGWVQGGVAFGDRGRAGSVFAGAGDPALARGAAADYCKRKGYGWSIGATRGDVDDPHLDVTCCTALTAQSASVRPSLLAFVQGTLDHPEQLQTFGAADDIDQLERAAREAGYSISRDDLASLVGGPRKRSASACGGLGQPGCQQCSNSVTWYFPLNFCCIPMRTTCVEQSPILHCDRGLSPNARGLCDVNRSRWKPKGLDTSRGTCGRNKINCWQYDDQVRDQLDVDPKKLNFVTTLDASRRTLPRDGRYIFVYRTTDDRVAIRPYDRDEADRAFAYPGNCRQRTQFGNYACQTPGGKRGRSLHVRHSQINGGWQPVWCAGEMRIEGGSVCLINNESGHFKPPAACTEHVEDTLRAWGVSVASGAVSGSFDRYSASKTCTSFKDEL